MWYRFYGHAGPGHQSSWEEYVWLHESYDGKEEELGELWEEMIPRWASYSHNAGGQEKVEELPEKVREQKIREARERLKSATEMLAILGAS
jgi:hypothetical protein